MTTTKKLFGLTKPKFKLTNDGKLRLLVLGSLTVSGLSVFLVFVNILYTRALVNKPFPSLVQLSDGTTVEIDFEDPYHRSPEVIQNFVSQTLYHLMTMTSYNPNGQLSALDPDREKAPPVKVKVGDSTGSITQQAWLASQALESNFGDTFREMLATMTPPDVFTGREEILLKINYITQPVAVMDNDDNWTGKWTVDVVGNLQNFRLGSGEAETIPFNKRITVMPTNAPIIHNVEEFGELAVALNKVQQSRLLITDMYDLDMTNVRGFID